MIKNILTLVACTLASVSFGYCTYPSAQEWSNNYMDRFNDQWDRTENRLYQEEMLRNQRDALRQQKEIQRNQHRYSSTGLR